MSDPREVVDERILSGRGLWFKPIDSDRWVSRDHIVDLRIMGFPFILPDYIPPKKPSDHWVVVAVDVRGDKHIIWHGPEFGSIEPGCGRASRPLADEAMRGFLMMTARTDGQ